MTTAPEPTPSARELELRRRLGDLAARATVHEAAWDRIQARLGDVDLAATRRWPSRLS